MKTRTMEIAELLDILPDEDVSLVNALIKKLVLAWDRDFVKVTPKEQRILEQSEEEMKNGIFVTEEEMWN
ncbi:hypothetical protein [Eubacterium oxidoreducens]|uniref:Addiction module component n=1 Tax=Eubacterium oxidoreducens TaxID=1732 RepID=A0A1G6B2V3_EUBOX|nr:hypothetical protein [Eubacterium oxidoreducens]SDB14869.1 hypothetical protein SAMN02910417_01087 [Eubacterium oxidoreducens]